ncbi:hypothetical protein PITCH_A180005 [uncultured Desulfobacterium sp.]|uniref:KilA-N DNA-binding domain-containing protein n=1 Tax=uncultured Desulfobacterium sp. TaxID=201089 RepID=A0A445MV32_9BACT|nr:hypothetical protein PITCH_A180005 [uncultured Desulfobacterium sp.]
MDKGMEIIDLESIEQLILMIRGQKVMLDRELSVLYGVRTKLLNQAVKRNEKRFPSDFMFQITKEEKDELVTNCDLFQKLKHSNVLPRVFTEQGVAMLSTVLNRESAIHKADRAFQFWQEGVHPEWIQNEEMMRQKVHYIHQNPVERGYVDMPEHRRYSTARNYLGIEGLLEVCTEW